MAGIWFPSLLLLVSVAQPAYFYSLRPGGRNVKTTYEYYYAYVGTSTKAATYRRTCSTTCANAWCWGRKRVCRTVTRYKWMPSYRLVLRSRPVYSCYSGWLRSGRECTKPYCAAGCRNGGICTSPNSCRCTKGWTGPYSQCRNDKNECTLGEDDCGINTYCINTPGSYTCECNRGFTRISRRTCKDVIECDASSGVIHGCQGTCVNLPGSYQCSCFKGYYLAYNKKDCLDVNECQHRDKNSCSYKPGCVNTPGSYRCECRTGYYLMSDQRSCRDKDECTLGQDDCGTNTICSNTPGSFICICKSGFTRSSRRTCQDIDECDSSSGVIHGCQGKCVNLPGSYNCSCSKGYYLAYNRKDCLDVDECSTNNHGCKQGCDNYRGGYTCTCRSGYRLNSVDHNSCDDVDECSEKIAGCAQKCNNQIGSFRCSCNKGYRLEPDLKSCEDVDECSFGLPPCQHNCLNTLGSYKCNCRPGFDLLPNGENCAGRPCLPLYSPMNGAKNCSGYTTEEVCHFQCSPGYHLIGSRKRTCTPSKRWSGMHTKCKIIYCSAPVEPRNGFVYSPCKTHFDSQCTVGCERGYYIHGTQKVSCNANGAWQPKNITCIEMKACNPNPCLHGGICFSTALSQYSCDCSRTGYKGVKCDVGHINIPDYPTLTPDSPSHPLTFQASPPSDYIVLTLINRDLEINPSQLVFKHGTSPTQSLTFTARKPGLHFIQYLLSGPSVVEFQSPPENAIFAKSSADSSSDNEPLFTDFNTLLSGCHKQQLNKCPRTDDVIYAASTSPWVTFGPLAMTRGVVNVEFGANNVPLSLFGATLPDSDLVSVPDHCSEEEEDVSYSAEQLLRSRVLEQSFLDAVRESLPKWLIITLRKDSSSKTIPTPEFQTRYLSGERLVEAGFGEGQPIFDETYFSLLLSKNLNFTIQNDVDIFRSLDHKEPVSLAVDLCGSSPNNVIIHPSLRDMDLVNNLLFMKYLKENGWNFKFYSLQISKKKLIQKLKKGPFWNGKRFFEISSSANGNMAIVSSFNKFFKKTSFFNSSVKFDGTIITDVDDIDNILDSPLRQEWKVDLHGKITLITTFQIQGKTTKLILKSPQSIGYAKFGGSIPKRCVTHSNYDPHGLFFTDVLEQDPFIYSELNQFAEMGSNKTLSCFLDTMIYSNKKNNKSTYSETNNGISMAFHGILKFGPLRFHNLHIQLSMRSSDCSNPKTQETNSFQNTGIEFTANYNQLQRQKLGIFERTPGVLPNIRLHIARSKNSTSTGSFQSVAKIFGFEKLVNVSFSYKGLSFPVSGKIHDLFNASMNCSSSLTPWDNQIFAVTGEFEDKSGGANLKEILGDEINKYAAQVVKRAKRRAKSIEETEKQTKTRLENVLLLEKKTSGKVKEIKEQYLIAERELELAKKELTYYKQAAKNYSQGLDEMKSELNRLCLVKQCPDICQEGEVCNTCYHDVIAEVTGVCPGICYKTKQHRLRPYKETVYCNREKCIGVYSTIGFFKFLFGHFFFALIRIILSFAISAVRSLFMPFVYIPRVAYWECYVVKVKCTRERFQYAYEDIPYDCEKPCKLYKVKKTTEKPCCSTASCAFFVVNLTCVAENSLCKKTRKIALDGMSKTKANGAKILASLEDARKNVSYWKIKKQKEYIKLMSTSRSLNTFQSTVRTLEKAYNVTVEGRERKLELLAKPLKLRALMDERLESVVMVKLEQIRFNAKVSPGLENTLFPIDIVFQLNGSREELSTVLDFRKLNQSLRSIAKEILSHFVGDLSSVSRKKRSVEDIRSSVSDPKLSALKDYHRLCSEVTNYEQTLQDVVRSLYNLSSEVCSLRKNSRNEGESPFNTSIVLTRFTVNETMASKLGINISNALYSDYLEADPEMTEGKNLQQEAIRNGYEPLEQNSKLLVYNWFATMEDIFNDSTIAYKCSGLNDCLTFILDSLFDIYSVIDLPWAQKIREHIRGVETKLSELMQRVDISVEDAAESSLEILKIFKDMTTVNKICESAPNITKHPEAFTEMGVGETLFLSCNASGSSLVYNWRFNDEILQDHATNVLLIKNTTVSHSGNYTCEVLNYVAKEASIAAVVVIHPPPLITVQPVNYLSVVISNDDSLECEAESSDINISYQWWYRSVDSISFYPLINETFPYLNFAPMKAHHAGWYFCNVSDSYGFSTSTISFVKALYFTLPVPAATLSLSVVKRALQNSSLVNDSNTNRYEDTSSQILNLLSSFENFDADSIERRIRNLNPVSCQFRASQDNKTDDDVEVCRWKFNYLGENTTSNSSINDGFETNTRKVINASQDVKQAISELVNATNNGSLDKQTYFVEMNSLAVQDFSLLCPQSHTLIQEDFHCVDRSCPPGFSGKLDENMISSCFPCSLGSYQPNSSQTSCVKCPEGFTTTSEGSYKKSQCKEFPNDVGRSSIGVGSNGTQAPCKNDLLLIVDTSYSIGEFFFKKQVKSFLQDLVTDKRLNVGLNGTRVSMIVFSDYSNPSSRTYRRSRDKTKVLIPFHTNYASAKTLNRTISRIRWDDVKGGLTRTDVALRIANTEIFPLKSPQNNRKSADDVILLITDGEPRGSRNTVPRTIAYAEKLKKKGVYIIGVGYKIRKPEFWNILTDIVTTGQALRAFDNFKWLKKVLPKKLCQKEGALCRDRAFNINEQDCCCGAIYDRKPSFKCCAQDYCDTSKLHCCDDSDKGCPN